MLMQNSDTHVYQVRLIKKTVINSVMNCSIVRAALKVKPIGNMSAFLKPEEMIMPSFKDCDGSRVALMRRMIYNCMAQQVFCHIIHTAFSSTEFTIKTIFRMKC